MCIFWRMLLAESLIAQTISWPWASTQSNCYYYSYVLTTPKKWFFVSFLRAEVFLRATATMDTDRKTTFALKFVAITFLLLGVWMKVLHMYANVIAYLWMFIWIYHVIVVVWCTLTAKKVSSNVYRCLMLCLASLSSHYRLFFWSTYTSSVKSQGFKVILLIER